MSYKLLTAKEIYGTMMLSRKSYTMMLKLSTKRSVENEKFSKYGHSADGKVQ